MYNKKKRIYEVIEVSNIGDSSSRAYDVMITVAVIALPTGIITAAYMNEISRKKSKYEL
ncbi:MAG: hypothetical protein IKO76_05060 [Butyrivibrio sp.]|nr:hypothetical protein [Butyrivibrio sp.]